MDVRVGRVHGWVVGLAALAAFGLIVGTVMAHGKAVHRTSPTGPSATAGKNVRAPTIKMVASQSEPNSKVSVRSVPGPSGTGRLCTKFTAAHVQLVTTASGASGTTAETASATT